MTPIGIRSEYVEHAWNTFGIHTPSQLHPVHVFLFRIRLEYIQNTSWIRVLSLSNSVWRYCEYICEICRHVVGVVRFDSQTHPYNMCDDWFQTWISHLIMCEISVWIPTQTGIKPNHTRPWVAPYNQVCIGCVWGGCHNGISHFTSHHMWNTYALCAFVCILNVFRCIPMYSECDIGIHAEYI